MMTPLITVGLNPILFCFFRQESTTSDQFSLLPEVLCRSHFEQIGGGAPSFGYGTKRSLRFESQLRQYSCF
jgi:hypothetical protein